MNMKMLDVLVTDVGEFDCPDNLNPRKLGLKVRKDRQPDLRYKSGKEWHSRFRKFSDQKLQEWLSA